MKSTLVKLVSAVVIAVMGLTLSMPLIALGWSANYSMTFSITDNSSTNRYNLPVLLDISGNALAALGYIQANGLDTNIYIGGSAVQSMISSDKVAMVVPSLASGGTDTSIFYMGYSPARTTMPIITGSGGNVTRGDNAALELGNSFNVTFNGYYNTSSSNATLLGKNNAIRISGTGGTVTADLTVVSSVTTNITSTWGSNTTQESLQAYGSVFATVRGWGSSNATAAGTSLYSDLNAGQYTIVRGAAKLIIPSLPAGAIVQSALLWIDRASTDTTYWLNGSTLPDLPFGLSAYGTIGGLTLADLFVTETPGAAGYRSFVVNAAGVSNIVSGSNITWASRLKTDYESTAPTGFNQYTGGSGSDIKLQITYTVPQPTVTLTATGVTQGEHTFTVSTASGNATLYIDGVSQATQSMGGYSVQDTANDWVFMADNSMPYMNSLSIAVSGVTQLTYQPNTMIIGQTLPDNTNDYDGTINWGTNSQLTIGGISTPTGGLAVMTMPATNVGNTYASLNGILTNTGNNTSVSTYFEYGTTTSYGFTTPTQAFASPSTFYANVGNLTYNTTYHFRAVAQAGTQTVYGYDTTFTTSVGTSGGTFAIGGANARVFENYITSGDMLFTVEIVNTYTPYYPTQSPKEFFTIQLIGTDNTTIIAATPQHDWGDKPVGIYLNPTMAANITKGAGYYMRLQGNFASNVTAQYQLQHTPWANDWKGTDLTKLDDWSIYVAHDMQVFYNGSGYTTVLADRSEAITEAVAGYFVVGIPGISQVRPNLFTASVQSPTFNMGINANTWDNNTAWATNVGASIAADAADWAAPWGLTGRDMVAGVIVLGMLGVVAMGTSVMGGFGALGLFLISIPMLWLGTYFKIIGVQYVMILTIIFGIMAIRQFWIKTT